MARRTAVEMSPHRQEIERRLANGDSLRSISKGYGISRAALTKHKETRLPQKVIKAAQKRDISDAQEIFEIILKSVRYMEKLADSCDDYLQDPDNDDLYYMGPRAHELNVIWEEVIGENDAGFPITKKHRESIQDLIDRTMDQESTILSIKTAHTDPRALIVKAAETLTKQMDTLVQAWRAVDQGKNSFVDTPAWNQVVKIILEETETHPEMRRKLADRLSRIGEEPDVLKDLS